MTAVYLFFKAILRGKPKRIVLTPNQIKIVYKNKNPLIYRKSEIQKIRFKQRGTGEGVNDNYYKFKIKLKNGKKEKIYLRDLPARWGINKRTQN